LWFGLVADLYEALHMRGIRLMVYLPSGAPAGDTAADASLEWRNGPYRNREFQQKWEHLELGDRWGKGAPRYVAQVVEWSKGVVKQGGAITWDTPLDATGKVAEAFLEQLGAVGKAVR
jgi:hypothetical protein